MNSLRRVTHRPGAAAPLLCALIALLSIGSAGCGGSAESQLGEIRSLQEAGQYEPSIAPLRKLLASESNHPEANYRLGIALVQTGRPSLAIWPLQKASESDEYAIQAGLVLATTLLQNQADEEAIRAATRVIEKEPGNLTALVTRAHAHLAAGHPEQTLEDANRILELRPGDHAASSLRAGALVDLNRTEEAEQTFKDMVSNADETNQDDSARKCAALATFYRSQKNDERALETFDECIAKYPNHAPLQQWVSDFFLEINRPERAIEVWRNAVEATPEDLSLRGKLSDLLHGQGHTDEAKTVLLEAVELFDTPQAWRMLASFYRKTGDPAEARKALEAAMERTQNVSSPMRFALADMLIEEGNLERAEEIAQSLKEPAYQYMLRGAISLARDEPKAALAQFDAGLRLWPNNAGARYLAGRAAEAAKDRKRAIAEYREAVRVGETETDASLRLAVIHFEMGQFATAMQFADRHIRKRPYVEPTAHIIGARSATSLGQITRAEAFLKNLKAKDKDSVVPYVELASIKLKTDGPQAAVDALLQSGIDLRAPANADALRALASNYIALGKQKDALDAVEAALAAHGDSPVLHDLQAKILLRRGDVDRARQAAEKALSLEPEFAPALAILGRIARDNEDLATAMSLFERAGKSDPAHGDYVYMQAQIQMMQGQMEEGVDSLRKTLEIDPSHVGANNDLAWILATQGTNLEQALELATLAVKMERNADTLDTLGYVHLKKGNPDEAVSVLGKALEARPNSPSIEYRLGVALAAKGNKAEAKEILTKALGEGAFPEAEAAKAELAKLQDS